jgi:hypothetical protein
MSQTLAWKTWASVRCYEICGFFIADRLKVKEWLPLWTLVLVPPRCSVPQFTRLPDCRCVPRPSLHYLLRNGWDCLGSIWCQHADIGIGRMASPIWACSSWLHMWLRCTCGWWFRARWQLVAKSCWMHHIWYS